MNWPGVFINSKLLSQPKSYRQSKVRTFYILTSFAIELLIKLQVICHQFIIGQLSILSGRNGEEPERPRESERTHRQEKVPYENEVGRLSTANGNRKKEYFSR